MLKWFGYGVAAFALLLLLALLALWGWFSRSLPHTPEQFSAAVQHNITIAYDQRRRPFVRAATWEDAFFAQGWLHANERLWQMELLRRAATGRLAEALGAGMLATDIELTKAGVPELGRRIQQHTSAKVTDYVAAYVRGVNAHLAQRNAYPPEFSLVRFRPKPWRSADVFAMGGLMAWQSGNNLSKELLRLALLQRLQANFAAATPTVPEPLQQRWLAVLFPIDADLPEFPYVVPDADAAPLLKQAALTDALLQPLLAAPGLGSNGWVVAPHKSATGKALFAFDSHDGFSMPNLTYDIHLFVGDEQIRGTSVPGLLGVINGFNEFMGWGFTNIGDSQDLFVEELHPEHEHRIKGRDGWYTARVEEELIPVAGATPHCLQIVHTRNGRLWSTEPPMSLRWSALEAPTPNLDALLQLNRATSYVAFEAAMDNFAAPSANATYADRDGRIAFRTTGVLPLRGRGQGLIPQVGSAADTAWRGTVPAQRMPRLLNPPEGFIAAANARVNPGTPLISADNAPGYRSARIQTVLAADQQLTAANMQALQIDWYNGQAARVLPDMLRDVNREGLGAAAFGVLDSLEAWLDAPLNQGQMREPLWFAAWYRQLGLHVFEPVLGSDLTTDLLGEAYVFNHALDRLLVLEPDSPWWQAKRGQTLADALLAALAEVGEVNTWQERHAVFLRHELSAAVPLLGSLLDSGPHPWGGGNPTVGRARYNYQRPFTATGGATVRLVLELGSTQGAEHADTAAYVISPGGQSGHFLSSHYDDQTASWLAGELDRLPATPELLPVSTTIEPEALDR